MGIQPYHQKVYNDLFSEFETIKRREEVKNQLFDNWKTNNHLSDEELDEFETDRQYGLLEEHKGNVRSILDIIDEYFKEYYDEGLPNSLIIDGKKYTKIEPQIKRGEI